MRAQDIKFKINDGPHKGEEYGFTLATVDGKKAWEDIKLFIPPPSLIKEQINIVVTAREGNMPLSGAIELKQVKRIIEQLLIIFDEITPVTMIGFDKQERLVRVDKQGPVMVPVIHEREKDPEYRVSLTCWGLYE